MCSCEKLKNKSYYYLLFYTIDYLQSVYKYNFLFIRISNSQIEDIVNFV